LKLLALMGSANKVPICFAGYDASDIAWVVLVPGLTGIAITSRRSYNPIEPIDRLELISAFNVSSSGQLTLQGSEHDALDMFRRAPW
jgi:hypothetical protein